jgi:hypothetical protein
MAAADGWLLVIGGQLGGGLPGGLDRRRLNRRRLNSAQVTLPLVAFPQEPRPAMAWPLPLARANGAMRAGLAVASGPGFA